MRHGEFCRLSGGARGTCVWFEQAACFQTDTPSAEVSPPRPALRGHALLAAAVWGFPGARAQVCLRILDPAAVTRPLPRHPPRRCPWAWQRTHSVCVFLGGKRGSVQAAEVPSGSRVIRGHPAQWVELRLKRLSRVLDSGVQRGVGKKASAPGIF